MAKRLFVLGAVSPAMNLIETLLVERGEIVAHALYATGAVVARVTPETAYDDWTMTTGTIDPYEVEIVVLVECAVPVPDSVSVVRIATDRTRPPAEFLPASNIGQVLVCLVRSNRPPPKRWQHRTATLFAGSAGEIYYGRDLAYWVVRGVSEYYIPQKVVFAAAADYNVDAALRGECPGVDPAAFQAWLDNQAK